MHNYTGIHDRFESYCSIKKKRRKMTDACTSKPCRYHISAFSSSTSLEDLMYSI